MPYFLTKININKVRHLQNISIKLKNDERQNLILTGKNGSGKTSVVEAIRNRFEMLKFLDFDKFKTDNGNPDIDVVLKFNDYKGLNDSYEAGRFILAYYAAKRDADITKAKGVERVLINSVYTVSNGPVKELIKYMVHLKTQQAYARNEGDEITQKLVADWFELLTNAIRRLLDDNSIELQYDYNNYDFKLIQEGREPYNFTQLSDGYSAAIYIMADLLMRMDQNWLGKKKQLNLSMEGIVLIDEIETHLHLELQRSIMPFLTEMFPNIQFIVTTHSPFVVTSLPGAAIYDLENQVMVEDGLSDLTYEGAVEGFFRADALSAELRLKYNRYKVLAEQEELSEAEYDEIADLEVYLDEIPDYLALGVTTEYKRLKLMIRGRLRK